LVDFEAQRISSENGFKKNPCGGDHLDRGFFVSCWEFLSETRNSAGVIGEVIRERVYQKVIRST